MSKDHKGLKGLSDIRSLFIATARPYAWSSYSFVFIFISSLMAIWSTRYIGVWLRMFCPKAGIRRLSHIGVLD